MRVRYYHVSLELPPAWGQVTGFGMYDAVMEWAQPPSWWQLMLVEFGGVLTVNGTPNPFTAKSLLVIPPASRCRIERTNGESVSQFWLKFRPEKEGQCPVAIPQIKALGTAYDVHDQQIRASMDLLPISRTRLHVMAWNLLWSVSESAISVPEEPTVAHVDSLIKADIGRPLTANGLAKEAGISPSQLNRMFRSHFGQCAMDYIRTLRMQQACVLLTNTNRPIKEIALRLGYPSLQRFNKVVRDTFGCSPRALRTDRSRTVDHFQGFASDENRKEGLRMAKPPVHIETQS